MLNAELKDRLFLSSAFSVADFCVSVRSVRMKRSRKARPSRRGALALLLVSAALVFGLIASSAKFDASEQSLFGARPITPAGALVMDATTRQPAVGALPVNFVRSPDRMGADGRGRYLVAVNSGTGVQFNA